MDFIHIEGEGPAISTGSSSYVKGQSRMRIHCEIFFQFNPKHPDFKDQFPYARCCMCKKEFPTHAKLDGITNIVQHLKYACVGCPICEGRKRVSGQSTLSQDAFGGAVVPHTFNQKRLERLCYEMVIRDEMAFRVVEGVGFRNFVHDLQPKFKIPDRKKVAASVFEVYAEEKVKIMSVIGNQRVSITTDTWTSIQNINYMVVTAHFKDSDWKLHKRIINFCKITSHKAEDIGRTLESCLRSWGIDKVFSITVDNASANDGAVNYMKQRLAEKGTLLFDGLYMHVRCCCHIINLIVKDGLEELYHSIEGVRNYVKFLHSSPPRLDKFREFAGYLNFEAMAYVPLDCPTRWNSTYKMLIGAAKYKMVFKRMSEDDAGFIAYFQETDRYGNALRVGPPVDADWEKANAIMHFLGRFYDATLVLSATKTCTSHLMCDEIHQMELEIREQMSSTNVVMRDVARSMMTKFNKYWGDFDQVNKLMYVALVLDPRFKLQMLDTVFTTLGREREVIDEMLTKVKGCFYELYNAYKAEAVEEEEVGLTKFQLVFKRQRMELEASEISNEVDKYLSDPLARLVKGFNLNEWWKTHELHYVVLSKLAKDLFSISSSTVASDNAFSLGGRVVDPFRASLTPRTVEALVCTNDWLRAEEFNFYKEPTDEEVEFYKELEDLEPRDVGSTTAGHG